MTDINTPEIVNVPLCTNGAPLAIAATNSPGTLIYAVPNDPDYWYEVTIVVSNLTNTDYQLQVEWGANTLDHRTADAVTKFTTKTLEARLCRGLTIWGYCLTAAGAAGAANALNVQVKSLRYKQARDP